MGAINSGTLVRCAPTTPGRRDAVLYRPNVDKVKPYKPLLTALKSTGGRNSHGRITSRFRGGGHKRKYRIINFKRKRDLMDIPAKVMSIEYDPNRTASIALIEYQNGVKEYMIAPEGLVKGQEVLASLSEIEPNIGNTMPIKFVPIGSMVCCVEMKPMAGAKIARSAGAYIVINGKEGGVVNVTTTSKEKRLLSGDVLVTVGIVSNQLLKNVKLGKAGKNVWKGRRPHQRGVSMNPVDHPLGGGEGKTSGGRHPVSPWGQLAKGYRTRRNKRTSKFILSRRVSSRKKK
ncbi:MAG: 50S ribosomal protein L2 [Alphaproteobacteria bacterium]|nr:50S ribosomal protein L2 [Rickettsiales bacterium]